MEQRMEIDSKKLDKWPKLMDEKDKQNGNTCIHIAVEATNAPIARTHAAPRTTPLGGGVCGL